MNGEKGGRHGGGRQGWNHPWQEGSSYPPPPWAQTWMGEHEQPSRRTAWSAVLIIPLALLLAFFLAVLLIGRPYVVRGLSMFPTLNDGDRVFVVPYRGGATPDRGDVVVIKNISGSPDMLIKRVVALAGDRVAVSPGKLLVNGKFFHRSTNTGAGASYTLMVPDNCVYVMGDNESHSLDSRSFGSVPLTKVVGKALFIFWPPSDFKTL